MDDHVLFRYAYINNNNTLTFGALHEAVIFGVKLLRMHKSVRYGFLSDSTRDICLIYVSNSINHTRYSIVISYRFANLKSAEGKARNIRTSQCIKFVPIHFLYIAIKTEQSIVFNWTMERLLLNSMDSVLSSNFASLTLSGYSFKLSITFDAAIHVVKVKRQSGICLFMMRGNDVQIELIGLHNIYFIVQL